MNSKTNNVRFIAHYLPQFHPIPENDQWWGKGFTEWTNVAKAKPLFPGHYQPRIPADLGFYDLRVSETRIAQAEMARQYGIEGFCYWHYWFAGKRLLERPFEEVLQSGQPNFPFCLAWANQSWTGIWHGAPDRILIEQTYPGKQDYESHFHAVLKSFFDDRYIKIDHKPVFLVFSPRDLPESKRFTDIWRNLAIKSGLKGIYFIGHVSDPLWVPEEHGFDASVINTLAIIKNRMDQKDNKNNGRKKTILKRVIDNGLNKLHIKSYKRPTIYSYQDAVKVASFGQEKTFDKYPCVIPNWDNTPRSNVNGLVFHQSTPDLFKNHLKEAIEQVRNRGYDKRVVFIKSWNEWAEGNYIEPDLKFGKSYLEVIKEINRCEG